MLDRGDEHERPAADAPDSEARAGSLRRPGGTSGRQRDRPARSPPPPATPSRARDTAGDDSGRDVTDGSRIPPRRKRIVADPVPPPGSRRFGIAVRIGAAIAIAAVVALLVAGWLVGWYGSTSGRLAAPGTAKPAMTPQLVIAKAAPAAVDDLVPLGISLTNADYVDAVVLSDLPSGSNITNGRPLADNEWLLFSYELADAAIRPDEGFVGGADITVELRHGNRIVDRQPLHLEWTRAAP